MKERFLSAREILKKKKVLAAGGIALVLFMVALVVVPRMFPEVGAATTTFDTARVISAGTTVVEPGEYYKITGTCTQTYTLSYNGSFSDDPAHIILDNATFQLSSDIPAIEFVGQEVSDETSSFQGNFIVHIKGENLIQSSAIGAKSALIRAENMTYSVKVYDKDSEYVADEMKFKKYSVSRTSKVVFTGTGSADDCLKLITAPQSYGAAIGSSEISTMCADITYKAGQGTWYLDLEETGADGITRTVRYKHGQEVFTGDMRCGSADITIQSGVNIIIEGNGNGAGIGTGASADKTVSFKGDKNLNTTNIHTVSASSVMDASDITISGGAVAISMAEASRACGIGTGAIAGEAHVQGETTITGGTIDVTAGTAGTEIAGPVNAEGKELFKFVLDVTKAAGDDKVITDNERFKLTDVVGGDRDYYAKFSGASAGVKDLLNFTVDVDDAEKDYAYVGYAGIYFDYLGHERMTFYLPTQKLVTYNLQVGGDLDLVTYSYREDDDDYSDLEAGYAIRAKEKKVMSIRLNNVPQFCTQISYQTSAGESGVITKNAAGEYVYPFTMPSTDYSIYFSYDIGRYYIKYDLGSDDAHILNGNPSNYVCGETLILQEPSWEGHTFAGWYKDAALSEPVTELTSTVVEDTITVYAKWKCTVQFVDDAGEVLYEKEVDYGTTFMESNYPSNPEDTSEKAFVGWEMAGIQYELGERPQFTVTEHTVITAVYEAVGYYVYVNATFTNQDGVTTVIDMSRAATFELYFQGQPIEFTQGPSTEALYYQTVNFADRTDITTGKATAKNGYKLAGIDVKDAAGNDLELFSTLDDEYAFSFMMPDKDVYITVNLQNPDYKITYYDYDDETSVFTQVEPVATETNPNVYEFNATTPEVTLNDAPGRSKYERFVGWYVFGDESQTIIHSIPTGAYSSDIALIAMWEDVVTYPIEVAEDIAEWVTVYDADGNEVNIGIPGEAISMVVEPGRGITFENIAYGYTDDDGGIYLNTKTPSEDMTAPYTYTFAMPGYKTEITGTFSLTEYSITYLGLLGAENPNPATYNVKSVIELEAPVKAGYEFKGWRIVLPDAEAGYESTKEEPISVIEDRVGNIVLVADWGDTPVGLENHKIVVSSDIYKGEITPYVTEAAKEQYVFVSITPERGYKLSKLYYYTLEEESVLQSRVTVEKTAFEVPLVEVSDGIYYFIMPDNGIELLADFEAIEYDITYINGLNSSNPVAYTVESVVELLPAQRTGYEFLGWYDDEENLISVISDAIGNLSLTAKWKEVLADTEETETTEPSDTTGDSGEAEETTKGGLISQLGQLIQGNKNDNSSEDAGSSENQVVKGQLSTGDESNIGHLVVICIICLIIALLAMPKKKKDEDEKDDEVK